MGMANDGQAPGHPRGLYLLCAVEFWERFSFYGLQANLIFFLIWYLAIDKTAAYAQFAAFAALVYLCPIVGGLVADRWVGARNAVAAGALTLLAGHSLLAVLPAQTTQWLIPEQGAAVQITRPSRFPGDGGDLAAAHRAVIDGVGHAVQSLGPAPGSDPAVSDAPTRLVYVGDDGAAHTLDGRLETRGDDDGISLFHLALALVAAGVGLLKPNISALVGKLYTARAADAAARDRGFLVFYLGINAGGLSGSITCGWLAMRVGWEWGFGVAGIGMVLALATLRLGRRLLPPDAVPDRHSGFAQGAFGLLVAVGVGGALALACWPLIGSADLVWHCLDAAAVGGIALAVWRARALTLTQRRDLAVLGVLMLASVLFWTLFYQTPASLNVFTAEWVDLSVGPLSVPAPVLQFTQQAAVMVLALPVAGLWRALDRYRRLPTAPARFAAGIAVMGVGFLLLLGGIGLAGGDAGLAPGKVGLLWLVVLYTLQGLAELFVSPTGLSAVSRLAPPGMAGMMLGLWFLSTAYAQKLAAVVSQATVATGTAGARLDAYAHVYGTVALYALAAGLVLGLLAPALKRLAPV